MELGNLYCDKESREPTQVGRVLYLAIGMNPWAKGEMRVVNQLSNSHVLTLPCGPGLPWWTYDDHIC